VTAPHRRWQPSLRLRLTIAGTVLAAAAFTVGGLVLLSIYRQSLIADTERQLSGVAYEVLASTGETDLPTPIPMPVAEGVPRLQVLDAANRVITADPASVQQPPMLTVPPNGTRRELVATDPGYLSAHQVYVLAVARGTPSERRTVVIAGSLDTAIDRASQAALLAGYAGAGSLAVVAALTWLLTGRALRPVEQLRSQVTAITASGDLRRRVPHPPRRDEIGRLAGTLNEMLRVLEAADRQQRQFIADAAHELRTPLAGITTFLEVTASHPGTVDQGTLLPRLLAAHHRFGDLVNDLLTLASIDARAPTRYQPVDLASVVRDCIGHPLTTRAKVTMTQSGEAIVLGNATHLSRVVANLLDNAMRHASQAVTVSVSTSATEALVAVADDGAGIPAGRQEEIWRRFVRLDDDRGRPHGGAGLGLALVKEIVTAHGGRATVRNAEPGAVFTVALPLAPAG
jgi:signal transduction histidine kinase